MRAERTRKQSWRRSGVRDRAIRREEKREMACHTRQLGALNNILLPPLARDPPDSFISYSPGLRRGTRDPLPGRTRESLR